MSSVRPRGRGRPFSLVAVVVCVGVGVASWVVLRGPSGRGPRNEPPLEALSVYGAVPDFSLIERSGRRVGRGDLLGQVWVADLVYTSCTETCPLQTAAMAALQQDLGRQAAVRLVSITVDPTRDTPRVLARYAERYRADPARWLFLTGTREDIHRLAQEGLRLAAVQLDTDERRDGTGPLLHSARFVLVDRQARVRGYYESTDAAALQRLRRDIDRLVREGS